MNFILSSNRSLRAAALALFALPLAACAADSDAPAQDAPVAQSAQAVQQDLTTVSALLADPAFQAFYQTFREVQAPFTRATLGMTPTRQNQLSTGLQSIQCSSNGCPELANYLGSFGITVDFNKLSQLKPMYDGLIARGATQPNMAKASVTIHGFDYDLHPNDGSGYQGSTDYSTCVDDCDMEFAWETFIAYTTYISALAGCAASGPAVLLCVASATIGFAKGIMMANHALEVCLAGCEDAWGCGTGSTGSSGSCGTTSSTLGDSCSYDSTCASAEHCSTLLQGVGGGKCTSDYGVGHTCTRGAWCATGNCVLAFCR